MRAASLALALAALLLVGAFACGPGRGGGFHRHSRKLTPLVVYQHEPNFSELSIAASGPAEGRVDRNHTRFRDLEPNYNPNIVFRDDEGTGVDRLMTQRCKEKLNTLAIMVMNLWPGTKLRVTEGWDEEGHLSMESLHYEGRAVDITTSDRDRSKYGMLARLAVEAGFDWVYYESKAYIHCSVKSETSLSARTGGCFPAASVVRLKNGKKKSISKLQAGELVMAQDFTTGALIFSEVLTFLDRDENASRIFVRVFLSDNSTVTATEAHLLLRASGAPVFAGSVVSGDRLLTPTGTATIVRVEHVMEKGVFAPLTRAGNLVVDGAVVSCYAAFSSQTLAHWSLAPLRAWLTVNSRPSPPEGVHPYVKTLYAVARYFLPADMFYEVK